ncbi:hypothetical protein SteCoe_34032 [Stentor coeruleus]|uniref:Reelin domain-containing protein n=1 Tax=Stentor coeruleus TaxID=5963 RepID=A0A1R2AVC9_9CILI|nr:hypothetical protein SteCoe_34032 [Stentor coeruleus]
MKAIRTVLLFLTLVYANTTLETNLGTQVGQPCSSTGYFHIITFDVTPWPPTQSGNSIVTISGVIRQAIGIGQIIYGIENQSQQWFYEYQTVDQTYNPGQAVTFTNILDWPSSPGSYLAQVTAHGEGNPNNIHACWTFSFSY